MKAPGDGREAVDGDPYGSYSARRLETVAAALGFLVAYFVTNEVIAAVAVAAVVYAFVHEQMSTEEDGEAGSDDAGSPTYDIGETSSSAAAVVDGPEGEVLATTADDARVDAIYDVVVTSPHPVQVELERSDLSDSVRWLRWLLQRSPLEGLSEHGALADPPLRVTEEVKRRVRNDLDTRSLAGGLDESGGKVGVAHVEADDEYDRFRYQVSYLDGRLI